MGTTAAVSQISDEDVKKHCIRYKLQAIVNNHFFRRKIQIKGMKTGKKTQEYDTNIPFLIYH
jgi:hypothetical protein